MAKIVLCEDEEKLQKLLYAFLCLTEHEVYVVENGLEGLALIERELPDIILTDISMPGLDGFTLAAMTRARPMLATIPIIFVTAFAREQDREEAARYAPANYLMKPFTKADLQNAIAAVLEGKSGENTSSSERC